MSFCSSCIFILISCSSCSCPTYQVPRSTPRDVVVVSSSDEEEEDDVVVVESSGGEDEEEDDREISEDEVSEVNRSTF